MCAFYLRTYNENIQYIILEFQVQLLFTEATNIYHWYASFLDPLSRKMDF